MLSCIAKAPFGIQSFLSDSFWFSINYYLGLEDDYYLGVVDASGAGADNSVQWMVGSNFISGSFVFYLDYMY